MSAKIQVFPMKGLDGVYVSAALADTNRNILPTYPTGTSILIDQELNKRHCTEHKDVESVAMGILTGVGIFREEVEFIYR